MRMKATGSRMLHQAVVITGLLCRAFGGDEQTQSVRLKRDVVHNKACTENEVILTCDRDEKKFRLMGMSNKVNCDVDEAICPLRTCHCNLDLVALAHLYRSYAAKKRCYDQIRSQTCNPERQTFTATNTTITTTCLGEEGSCAQKICECVTERGINHYTLGGAVSKCYDMELCESVKKPTPTLNVKISMTCADEDVCAQRTCGCYQKAVRNTNLKIGKNRLKNQ